MQVGGTFLFSWFQTRAFLYKYKSDRLQRSTFAEMDRKEAGYGPRALFLIPSYLEFVVNQVPAFLLSNADALISATCFLHKDWMKRKVCKIHFAGNLRKPCQIWTSELLFYTFSRGNPVKAEWHRFIFRFQMSWFQTRAFLNKCESDRLQRSTLPEIDENKPDWISGLLSYILFT